MGAGLDVPAAGARGAGGGATPLQEEGLTPPDVAEFDLSRPEPREAPDYKIKIHNNVIKLS